MGWLTPAKPWLPPLPVGLCVPVGNFIPAASKSSGQESRSAQRDPRRRWGQAGAGGRTASAMSAVTQTHAGPDAAGASPGLCLGKPSTGSHLGRLGHVCLMAVLEAGKGHPALPSSWDVSSMGLDGKAAAAVAAFWCQLGCCSSRPGWCGLGKTGTSRAGEEEAVGTVMQKASLLKLPLGPNAPFAVPSCSFPAALAAPRAQPRHSHLAVAAGTDSHVCCSPFIAVGWPNTSPQGSQHKARAAGSMFHPQTSRVGTVAELQAAAEQTKPVKQPCGCL